MTHKLYSEVHLKNVNEYHKLITRRPISFRKSLLCRNLNFKFRVAQMQNKKTKFVKLNENNSLIFCNQRKKKNFNLQFTNLKNEILWNQSIFLLKENFTTLSKGDVYSGELQNAFDDQVHFGCQGGPGAFRCLQTNDRYINFVHACTEGEQLFLITKSKIFNNTLPFLEDFQRQRENFNILR